MVTCGASRRTAATVSSPEPLSTTTNGGRSGSAPRWRSVRSSDAARFLVAITTVSRFRRSVPPIAPDRVGSSPRTDERDGSRQRQSDLTEHTECRWFAPFHLLCVLYGLSVPLC